MYTYFKFKYVVIRNIFNIFRLDIMEARFTTYQTISAKACPIYLKLKYQQAKRRQEVLEIQKQ